LNRGLSIGLSRDFGGDMQPLVLAVHNVWRWVVVIAAIAAIVKALVGWVSQQPWSKLDDRLGMLYTIALDVQVLIGLILYILEQRWRLGDPFFAYVHPIVMIVALALAHIGRSRSRRAENPVAKHRTAAVFFLISFFLVVAAIPWQRRLLPF
jgi:hypothetical protein